MSANRLGMLLLVCVCAALLYFEPAVHYTVFILVALVYL